MVNKMCFAVLLASGICYSPASFAWDPTLSLLASRTLITNEIHANAGVFDIQNRKINFGFEFTDKFYLHDAYFFKTGIRYNTFKTGISSGKDASAAIGRAYHIYWDTRYEAIAVPIHFGKEFVTDNGHKGDVYGGVSVGLYGGSSVKAGTSLSGDGGPGAVAGVTTSMPDISNILHHDFLTTADFGANYQPFKDAPRFTLGLLCSVQLTKTTYSAYRAVATDDKGNVFNYNVQYKQQFINCALSLSYTFGKLKPAKTYMLPTN